MHLKFDILTGIFIIVILIIALIEPNKSLLFEETFFQSQL